jgi:surfeit locus 1 family protein
MTHPEPARPRFPLGLTLTVMICEVILVGLGAWQLQRLQWKTGVLAHVAAVRSAPAVPLGALLPRLARGEDLAYARVSAICPGLAFAPAAEVFSIRDGEAGVRLVSACRLAAGPYGSILVDRGFVPDSAVGRPRVDAASSSPTAVTGVLRAPEPRSLFAPANPNGLRLWYWRDLPRMAAVLHAQRPAPVFLAAETRTNPEFAALTPAPVPVDIPNNHFAYALTWFGLAAGLAGVYFAMLFRRPKLSQALNSR